jgi:hypothetical protein
VLHMRVISPVEKTEAVRDLLLGEPGATRLPGEGRYAQARGPALQLLVNLVGIVVAAIAVPWCRGG